MKLLSKFNINSKEDFWKLAIQILKFGIVGLSNTIIALAIYYGLIYIGMHYIVANTIAFLLSVLNAYYWSNKYVFEKTSDGHKKALIKTYLVYGSTFLLGTVTLFLMVNIMDVSQWIAPIINLLVTIPINFVLNKFWAFK